MPVTFKEIVEKTKEKHTTVRYWQNLLTDAELIEPVKGYRNKLEFSQEDLAQFLKLQELMDKGCNTFKEAIHLMRENVSPVEALEAHRRSQQEIAQLQKKVLALRKPTIWEKISKWFGSIFRKKVNGKKQRT